MVPQDCCTLNANDLARVDSLFQRAELLTFPGTPPQAFHEQLIPPLMTVLQSQQASIWLTGNELPVRLFAAAIDISEQTDPDTQSELNRAASEISDWETVATADAISHARCPVGRGEGTVVRVRRELIPSRQLVVEFQFASGVEIAEETEETLHVMCGIVAEYHRGRLLNDVQHQTSQLRQLAVLSRALHQKLDHRHVASVLAGDATTLCAADRISVLRCGSTRSRLVAVTGVTTINDRADVSQAAERLVNELRRCNQNPDWITADSIVSEGTIADGSQSLSNDRATQAVQESLRISGAKSIRVMPLNSNPESWDGAIGAVVFERFSVSENSLFPDESRTANNVVFDVIADAAQAFGNALEFERRSLAGRVRAISDSVQSLRFLAAGSVLLAAALFLSLVPADFDIEVTGQMQPEMRRRVFAPDGGVIRKVFVRNEQQIRAGDILLEIRNPELDIEEQRVRGEIQTTVSRQAAVEAARHGQGGSALQKVSTNQLSSEKKLLEQRLETLERQLELIRSQIDALSVRSPINGRVLRRDLVSDLQARPVQQGQQLLEIIQPDGAWQLELRVPDRVIRHVLGAQEAIAAPAETKSETAAAGSGLPVRFILRTAPESTWQETLSGVSGVTDLDETGQLSSLATVPLTSVQPDDLRPGAGVIASIRCGRRPIGFVWFRELIEFVQTHVLF